MRAAKPARRLPSGHWGSGGTAATESPALKKEVHPCPFQRPLPRRLPWRTCRQSSPARRTLPSGSFTLGNTTYTSASLIQVFQDLVSAMQARNVAETSAKDALTAEQAAQAQTVPILRAYERLVLAAFANASQTLADFGLTPPKARTPLTAQQLAARAAKARATRVARGTTSKKKKLAVKGDVTGVVVTPVTAPTAAVPTSPEPPVTPASPSAQPASTTSGTPTAGTAEVVVAS